MIVPDSVTTIPNYAFNDCDGFEHIWIGESVTSIGNNSFTNCDNLTIHGTVESKAEEYASNNSIPFSTEPISNYLKVTVDGTVEDGNGNGIPNVNVYIYNVTEKQKLCELVTDENGYWSYKYAGADTTYTISYYHTNYLFNEEEQTVATGAVNYTAPTVVGTKIFETEVITPVSEFSYEVVDNSYVRITGFKGTEEIVAVPSEIDGYPVESISGNAFKNNGILRRIIFPGTIDNIGTDAFYGCANLTNVRFPIGITAIGARAFMNCTSLTEITLPDTVSSIGYRAFYGDVNLESVKLSRSWSSTSGYSSYPTYYGEIFANCVKLTSVSIAEGASTVPAYAFYGCTNLTSIEIPDSVETVNRYAFYNCDGVTSIDLPEGLLSIGNYAFSENDGITGIHIPDTVTSIGYRAFTNCSRLTDINYPASWSTCIGYSSYPTLYGEIFDDCAQLTSIVIPEGVTTIPAYAFYGCPNLADIQIPSTVTKIGNYAFYDCDGLTTVLLPYGLESIGYYAFANSDGISAFDIPETVTTIGYRAFAECNGLTTATYPAGWNNHIGYSSYPTLYGSIFAGCEKLTKIVIPEGVTVIPTYAFQDCTNLREIEFPETLKTIDNYAFDGCTGIVELDFPDELNTIGTYSFSGCNGLVELNLPDSVTTFGYRAFSDCVNLRSATYPAGWTTCLGYSSYPTLYGSIFSGCSKLKSITVPDGVTTIPEYAFYGSELRNIKVANSVETIGRYAFANCDQLRYVESEFLSLKNINNFAFENDSRLKSLTLSENVVNIGSGAFNGCSSLTILCPKNSKTEIYLIDNGIRYELYESYKEFTNDGALDKNECFYVADTVAAKANGYISLTVAYGFTEEARPGVGNLSLKIRLPANTTLLEKTLMIDGVRATGYDLSDNVLTIALKNTAGRVSFNVAPSADSGRFTSYAMLSFKKSGVNTQEVIGTINESIPVISVSADREVNTPTVRVSGVGPADSVVSIYIDGVIAGTARTNKIGSYEKAVTISDPKDYKTYVITAAATFADESLSASCEVLYCVEAPTVQSVSMTYNGNTYDMSDNSSMKPIVTFTPGSEFKFDVKMTNPDKVDKVFICSTRSNVTKRIEATYDAKTGNYVAKGLFDRTNSNYVPGTITVEYSQAAEKLNFHEEIDFSSQKYINGGSNPITAALAGKVEDCIEDLVSTDNKLSGVIKLVDADALLDFNILTDIIPSYLDPDNAGKYGYVPLEDDYGTQLYLKVAENFEDKLRGEVIDFAEGKITEFLIEGKHISGAIAVEEYFSFVEALGYVNKMVTWDNRRVDLNEAKQAILSSNMTDAEKAEALEKIDFAHKMNNGTVAVLALSIILKVAGIALPFPASMILPLLSMSQTNYVKDILSQFGHLGASESKGTQFDFRWKIDPSGYVYEGVTSNRVPGVSTTAYFIPYDDEDLDFWDAPDTEKAILWDASEYSQTNPITTDSFGNYAWDVPEGWWLVKYELDGYETAYSEWMPVPPPQTNVNIGLVSLNDPTVEKVDITDGVVMITFDQYIDPETIGNVQIFDESGTEIPYTVDFSRDETSPDGTVYARTFTITADGSHSVKKVLVPSSVINYCGRNVEEYETNHVHQYEAVVTEPTCTEQGYTTHTCPLCQDSYVDTYVDALGHDFGDWTVKTEPTCTVKGTEERICTRCEETEIRGIDTAAHTPAEKIRENDKAPTCTANCSYDEVVYCSVCGTELNRNTETIDALGHDFGDWTVKTEPTCTETGTEERICARCGAIETREVDSIAHIPTEAVRENEKAATCTADGSYDAVVYCSVCGAELSREAKTIDSLGHDYVETVTAPTCTEQGYTTHSCLRCDSIFVDTYVDALGHDFGEWTTAVAATCTADGSEVRVCSRCSEKETRTTEATGHDFGAGGNAEKCAVCNEKNPNYKPPVVFKDVPSDAYYKAPVDWAVANGITAGTSSTTFSPDDGCTRGQVVTFLWRAAGQPEPTLTKNPFKDVKSSEYYYKAVLWAVENSVTAGTSSTTFSPNDTCTRGQIVTFLYRAKGEPKPSSSKNPFSDVKAADYYYNAVLWAVEKKITLGTDSTHFSPSDTCTRAQVVTFLYRDRVNG